MAEKKEKTKARKILNIIGIILLIVIAVFAVLVAAYHQAARAIFYNAVTPSIDMDTSDSWDGGKSYTKVPYSEVSPSDYVDIYVPDDVENPPLLVLVHGGGFIVNDSQARQTQLMYRYFRDHGYACASVNYRLADEAQYPGALEDVKACVRFLKAHAGTYGYDPERVGIFGESAGAYLAILAAVTNDEEFEDISYIGEDPAHPVSASVKVLVDFYGSAELGVNDGYWERERYPKIIIRLANSWLSGKAVHGYESSHSWWIRKNESELTAQEKKKYSAYTYIDENITKRSSLSVYISHGNCDLTVPILASQDLYDKLSTVLGPDRVEYNVVDKSGHAKDLMYTDTQLARLDTFLRAHL